MEQAQVCCRPLPLHLHLQLVFFFFTYFDRNDSKETNNKTKNKQKTLFNKKNFLFTNSGQDPIFQNIRNAVL